MEEAVEGVWVGQKQLLKVVEVVVERGMRRNWIWALAIHSGDRGACRG